MLSFLHPQNPALFSAYVLLLSLCCLLAGSSENLAAESPESLPALKQFEESLVGLARRIDKSVAAIAVSLDSSPNQTLPQQLANLIQPEANTPPASLGFGVVIAKQDDALLLLTTAHLIEPAIRETVDNKPLILLIFSQNILATAEVYACDPRSDLAVLRVSLTDFPGLATAEPVSNAPKYVPQQGSLSVACSDPESLMRGQGQRLGLGLLSATAHSSHSSTELSLMERSLRDLDTLVRVDLPRTFAADGVPIFSLDGHLTGMVTTRASGTDFDDSSLFAIPFTPGISRLVKDLEQGLEVEYGFLGIGLETSRKEDVAHLDLDDPQPTAVLVTRVAKDSPAAIAGIKRGDLILRVNDRQTLTSEELIREVGLIPPGESASLLVLSGNDGLSTLSVQLGKWPIYDDSLIVVSKQRYPAWRGLQVDYATGRRRYLPDLFLSEYPGGVAVSNVESNGPSAASGLQVGQIIVKVGGIAVNSPKEFSQATEKLNGDVIVELKNGTSITISAFTENSVSD